MPALAKNYTVVAPDLRSLGDSSKPFTGYDGNTTAEDIYQLLSQLGLGLENQFSRTWYRSSDGCTLCCFLLSNVSSLVILSIFSIIGTVYYISRFYRYKKHAG